MTGCRLLALDLDGTLLRDDGQIDPRDRAALADARARGMVITLVTGRLPHTTLPIARALGLDGPLLCADGALVIAGDGAVLRSHSLPGAAFARCLALAQETATPLMFLGVHEVLGRPEHQALALHLQGWSDRFVAVDFPGLQTAIEARAPLMAGFLVGTQAEVLQLGERFGAAPVDTVSAETWAIDPVPLGEAAPWVLRVRAGGIDKGIALGRLAAQLGIDQNDVAAVGDWYNDVPMLLWAGRSFAMGHAPADVAQAAQQRLRSTAATGGAIAEALALLQDQRR
jgi:hydroxymethylpyrimidine pyrophosphatase-like HAD family hydrolase